MWPRWDYLGLVINQATGRLAGDKRGAVEGMLCGVPGKEPPCSRTTAGVPEGSLEAERPASNASIVRRDEVIRWNEEDQPGMGCHGSWLALVAVLILGPIPSSRSCLQCDPNFALRIASYAPHLSRKSWGLGDVPAAGRRLRGWAQDTLHGLRLGVPAEIPMDKLQEIATKVYAKMDRVFKGHTYKPGVLPEILRSIFEEQVKMLRNAIIESKVKCERHCGINQYEGVSCETCNKTKPTCFGYNCESSEKWEEALKGLYKYINNLRTQPGQWSSALKQLPGFSHCMSKSPENLNFTSIGRTLSKNWLNMMAVKELEGETPALQLLAPSC